MGPNIKVVTGSDIISPLCTAGGELIRNLALGNITNQTPFTASVYLLYLVNGMSIDHSIKAFLGKLGDNLHT